MSMIVHKNDAQRYYGTVVSFFAIFGSNFDGGTKSME